MNIIIRATRGRNQIVFDLHKLNFFKCAHACARARAHAPHYRLDSTRLNFRENEK
jgi:hypothetical protein